MSKIIYFNSNSTFVEAASNFLAAHILELAQAGSSLSLFLSGGSTPGPIYSSLSTYDLPWTSVDVGLVDERWVEETDKGSNAALIRQTLLQNSAKTANFVPMKSYHASAVAGQDYVEAAYQPLLKPQSIAVLGMGNDGHTASWFSGAEGLPQALAPFNKKAVQAIIAMPTQVTGKYLQRMTLTLQALRQCRTVLLLIKGQEKYEVLQRALSCTSPELPISYLLPAVRDRLTILYLET